MKKEGNEISCTSCNTRYLANRKNNMEKNKGQQTYTECQSCGARLTEDFEREHLYYCIRCWKGGEFKFPHITLEKMKDQNNEFLIFEGYSYKDIKKINSKLKKLERWKN